MDLTLQLTLSWVALACAWFGVLTGFALIRSPFVPETKNLFTGRSLRFGGVLLVALGLTWDLLDHGDLLYPWQGVLGMTLLFLGCAVIDMEILKTYHHPQDVRG